MYRLCLDFIGVIGNYWNRRVNVTLLNYILLNEAIAASIAKSFLTEDISATFCWSDIVQSGTR